MTTTTTTAVAAGPSALLSSVAGSPPRRGALALVAHQLRYDAIALLRNRQARFFTLAMPVGFLVLFVAIFGNGTLPGNPDHLRMSTYYVANLTAFGIVDAGFMTLTITLVEMRESGVLRRRRAAPQPPWVILGARAVTALAVSITTALVLLLIGRLAYRASVAVTALPALVTAVAVGCLASCVLGFAAATTIRSNQAAQPVTMALTLPLFFISGVFVPWSLVPRWLRDVAVVFPVRHLAESVLVPFTHTPGASPWNVTDLLVVAAWGVVGLVVALRRFTWAPRDV
jgi:ABC-2 type transport system permease protein